MVKITISNLNNLTLQSNDNPKTVLSILQENYIDWMHACGAKGRCTTCKMIIEEGGGNLSGPSESEIKYFNAGRINLESERLSCQCTIKQGSEIKIAVPEDCKLPHIEYSK